MFKVNNKYIRTTPVASLLLTLNIFHALPCSSVSTVSFEHVIAGWVWKEGRNCTEFEGGYAWGFQGIVNFSQSRPEDALTGAILLNTL